MKLFFRNLISLYVFLLSFLGVYAQHTGNKRVEFHIDSLKSLLDTPVSDTQRIHIYSDLVASYIKFKLDSAKYFADKKYELSTRVGYDKGIYESQFVFGMIAAQRSQYNEAMRFYRKSWEEAYALKDTFWVSKAKLAYSWQLAQVKRLDSAKKLLQELLPYFEKEKAAKQLALIHLRLANIFLNSGESDSSFIHCEKAIAYGREANDYIAIGDAYSNIGVTYYHLDAYEKAISYFEDGLSAHEKANYDDGIGRSLGYLSSCYIQLKDYSKALLLLEEAKELFEKYGSTAHIIACLTEMAQCYIDMGSYEIAKATLAQSFQLIANGAYVNLEALSHELMAQASHKLNEHSTAEFHYIQAVSLMKHIGDPRNLMNLHRGLVDFYSDQGKYQSALQSFKAFKQIEDSLFNIDKVAKIAELQTQYETVEKEKEIAELKRTELLQNIEIAESQRKKVFYITGIIILLMSGLFFFYQYNVKRQANELMMEKNKIINSQNAHLQHSQTELTSLIQEKEALLREIHHRVKNNLQVISSLLAVQAHKYDHPAVEAFVANGRARVQAMALVHQFLYQETDTAYISYGKYLHRLTSSIFDYFNISERISYKIKAEDIDVNIDVAIPLGLITNEVLTNALKHAFPNDSEGEIDIFLEKHKTDIRLIIADNGRGLTPEDLKKSNSFGMNLIKNMVNKLEGNYTVKNVVGTRFMLTFPYSNIPNI